MPLGANYEKKIWKKLFFFCILKINEERSRIRSWIRIHKSEVRIRGSGSAPKCRWSHQYLILEELVLQRLLARVGARPLEALLVLAVVLRHLPHLDTLSNSINRSLWSVEGIRIGSGTQRGQCRSNRYWESGFIKKILFQIRRIHNTKGNLYS